VLTLRARAGDLLVRANLREQLLHFVILRQRLGNRLGAFLGVGLAARLGNSFPSSAASALSISPPDLLPQLANTASD
jgi:hypothetical protein